MPQTNLNLGRLLAAPSLKEMALATIKEAMFSKKLEQEVMHSALEEIRDLTNLAGLRSLEVGSRTGEAIEEHERIVAELKGRSLSGALSEMEAHIRTPEARVLVRVGATKKAL